MARRAFTIKLYRFLFNTESGRQLRLGGSLLLALICGCMPALAGSSVSPQYTGRGTCAECHAEQLNQWSGSHHDLAMQEASEQTVLGNFNNATLTHYGVTSTFFKKDGRFWVRTDGPDGKLQDYPIRYAFGVHPLQQYLVEFPGGRLQALSLSWDTRSRAQGGQRWFHLYPDEKIGHDDELHWTGPNQNWNNRCQPWKAKRRLVVPDRRRRGCMAGIATDRERCRAYRERIRNAVESLWAS